MILRENNPFKEASFSLGNRLKRQLWNVVQATFFRMSPRPLHRWRVFLLRLFGAHIGTTCHIYPRAKIWAPWNLKIGNFVGIGDDSNLYSMAEIEIGSYVVISQGAHLCCGSHDYDSANFQLFAKPIRIGSYAWICAEAFILPGVLIAEGVVIGARSVVSHSIPQCWTVCAGFPCRVIRSRKDALKQNINNL